MKNFHLPGLNGIRAIACLMVFYHHVNSILGKYYSFSAEDSLYLGPLGVTCFFTLSGFLITTLLLKEKTTYNDIDLKKFYIRRILRIWPLYFLIIIIGSLIFLMHPQQGEKASYFYFYIFFVGNLAYSMGRAIWSINVLWSVGVEEQFYAFWPFIIRSNNVLKSILIFLIAFLGIKLYAKHLGSWPYNLAMNTGIDCMAIGALFAYANFKSWSFLKLFYYRIIQVLAWGAFISSFVWRFHISTFIDNEAYSLIIGIIILNVSCNPATIFTLENSVLKYLGKISYGIYAYHMLIILAWTIFFVPDRQHHPASGFFIPFAILGITILVAHISYFYFEKRFLERKHRYSTIPTAA